MFGKTIARIVFWFCYTHIAQRRRPDFIVGEPGRPYLLRWWLFGTARERGEYGELRPRRIFGRCVYLHCFLRSDDDRALHDHPWDWASFILKGGYMEHVKGDIYDVCNTENPPTLVIDNRSAYDGLFDLGYKREAGTLRYGKAAAAHRVELFPADTRIDVFDLWPLSTDEVLDIMHNLTPAVPCWTLFFTGPYLRPWGFHCPKGWVPWREFVTVREGGNAVGAGCGDRA